MAVGSKRPGTTAGRRPNRHPRDPGRSRRQRPRSWRSRRYGKRSRLLGVPRPQRRLRRRPAPALPEVRFRPGPAAGPRRASPRPRNRLGWSVAKLPQRPTRLRSRKQPGARKASLPGPPIRGRRRTGRHPQRYRGRRRTGRRPRWCLGWWTTGPHPPVTLRRLGRESRRRPTTTQGRKLSRLRTGPVGTPFHQLLTSRRLRTGLRPQPGGILLMGVRARTDLQRLPVVEQGPSGWRRPRRRAGSGPIRRRARPARSGGRRGRGARRRRGRQRPRTGRPIAPRLRSPQPLRPRR